MSEYYNVVPWFNSKEWLQAYDYIYTNSNKSAALKLLLIWKARCPSLPSGIESTLTLLEVLIQDESTFDNDQLLRLAYSSALMRFVNHMLDTETSKGTSLYQAAKNLDVPDWIIDLRHDTAHSSKLPTIEILREASTISMEWLEKNYWSKYKECIQDYKSGQKVSHVTENNKAATLIHFCISLSFCTQSKVKIKNLADIPNPFMRESIIIDATELFQDQIDMSNLKTVSITSLINLLNSNSKKWLKSKDAVIEAMNALLGDESIILSLEVLSALAHGDVLVKKKLNVSYVQCFELLITFLHTNDLLLDFVLELIQISHKTEDNDRQLLAALWVSEILRALNKSKQFIERMVRSCSMDLKAKNSNELRLFYHHWFPNEKTKGLILDMQKPVPAELMDLQFLLPIISTYNPNLKYFIKNLLSLVEPSLPTHVQDSICNLAEVLSCPKKSPVSSSRIYTVDDLDIVSKEINESNNKEDSDIEFVEMTEMEVDQNEHNNCDNISYGVFKLSSSVHCWSNCPIGLLPWQTM